MGITYNPEMSGITKPHSSNNERNQMLSNGRHACRAAAPSSARKPQTRQGCLPRGCSSHATGYAASQACRGWRQYLLPRGLRAKPASDVPGLPNSAHRCPSLPGRPRRGRCVTTHEEMSDRSGTHPPRNRLLTAASSLVINPASFCKRSDQNGVSFTRGGRHRPGCATGRLAPVKSHGNPGGRQ